VSVAQARGLSSIDETRKAKPGARPPRRDAPEPGQSRMEATELLRTTTRGACRWRGQRALGDPLAETPPPIGGGMARRGRGMSLATSTARGWSAGVSCTSAVPAPGLAAARPHPLARPRRKPHRPRGRPSGGGYRLYHPRNRDRLGAQRARPAGRSRGRPGHSRRHRRRPERLGAPLAVRVRGPWADDLEFLSYVPNHLVNGRGDVAAFVALRCFRTACREGAALRDEARSSRPGPGGSRAGARSYETPARPGGSGRKWSLTIFERLGEPGGRSVPRPGPWPVGCSASGRPHSRAWPQNRSGMAASSRRPSSG
jgi:hypothetical protein